MAKGFLDGYKTYDTTGGHGHPGKWKSAFRQRMSTEDARQILNKEQDTPYSILGIAATATKTEIKKAFRELINQWHPDKNQHRIEEAEHMSKKIIAAYSLLTNQ
ncbi:J domain-containing protein [Paraflavitalea pollutisoli]|uniref:J domain-containing protein n=1 Tax=Paraflavitalea pollutisoli TaxID=3034143 RepID=UPI0023EB7B52|nr:J domain-containing protein [Paraflavitalea sp. H1-2-19X]